MTLLAHHEAGQVHRVCTSGSMEKLVWRFETTQHVLNAGSPHSSRRVHFILTRSCISLHIWSVWGHRESKLSDILPDHVFITTMVYSLSLGLWQFPIHHYKMKYLYGYPKMRHSSVAPSLMWNRLYLRQMHVCVFYGCQFGRCWHWHLKEPLLKWNILF